MKKYEVITNIIKSGIVAVLRSKSQEEAKLVAEACEKGGIKCIEVTFSVPGADEVIGKLKNSMGEKCLIGAGTVIDEISARLAILAGADFIVAPNFSSSVAMICNTYGIPYIPGCMTINEIVEAMKYGVDIIKLFPANQYNLSIIKSIQAPIPHINIMVTGGIEESNIKSWINAGAAAVGIGGNLTTLNGEDYSFITENAKKYINTINSARSV